MLLSSLFAILVNFSWQAPTSGPTPNGYKLVLGDASGTKTTVIDVGNKISHTMDVDLTKVKFIAVKSYNEWGDSTESNEVLVGKPLAATNFKAMP